MSLGAGKAMHTLDIRESRSSLAGVLMAAAMEGVGLYEFSEHLLPHLEQLPHAVSDVLSRVDLPALPGRGALAGSPPGASGAEAHAAALDAAGGSAPGGAGAAGAGSVSESVAPAGSAAGSGGVGGAATEAAGAGGAAGTAGS